MTSTWAITPRRAVAKKYGCTPRLSIVSTARLALVAWVGRREGDARTAGWALVPAAVLFVAPLLGLALLEEYEEGGRGGRRGRAGRLGR